MIPSLSQDLYAVSGGKTCDEVVEGELRQSWQDHKDSGCEEGAHHADHRHFDCRDGKTQWNWSGFGCLISKII